MSLPLSIPPLALAALMTSPGAPRLIDIRLPEDIATAPGWFPGAVRLPFGAHADHLAAVGSAGAAVVICHGGLKLSQGVAARLRGAGVDAACLAGGTEGWRAAGLPLVRAGVGPGLHVAPWTRDAATAARVWAATRFLPQPAEILTVAPDQVAAAAARFDGAPLPEVAALAALLDGPWPGLAGVAAALDAPEIGALFDGLSQNDHAERAWQLMAFAVLDALCLGHADRAGEDA